MMFGTVLASSHRVGRSSFILEPIFTRRLFLIIEFPGAAQARPLDGMIVYIATQAQADYAGFGVRLSNRSSKVLQSRDLNAGVIHTLSASVTQVACLRAASLLSLP